MEVQSPIKLSPQGQAIVDFAVNGKGSLNVTARAGCGKTTVLMSLTEALVEDDPTIRIFLGAYNRSIANEIKAKLEARGLKWPVVDANTMHSLGYRLWKNACGAEVPIENDKVKNILAHMSKTATDQFIEQNAPMLAKSVSLAKQNGFGLLKPLQDRSAWYAMLDHHGVDDWISDLTPQRALDVAITHCIEALQISIAENHKQVDYDDMLLAPLVGNVRIRYPYDIVGLDEAQDTNPVRRALALKVMKPRTGRLIAVGDDRQAIYGFTGADADAMQLIKAQLNSVDLPLTVTYRCPKAVVKEANRYVKDIVAHESAPEGRVLVATLKEENTSKPLTTAHVGAEPKKLRAWVEPAAGYLDLEPNDVILCRNTAPLITLAFMLIRRKTACKVEGKDIGVGLLNLAKRWKPKNLTLLRGRVKDYLDRERAKWLAKGREEKAEALEEKVESLVALIDACLEEGKEDVASLKQLVTDMFEDSYSYSDPAKGSSTTPAQRKPMLTLSTIHKSKGREWDRVFLLDADKYMPSSYARKEWQLKQEDNLAYVAVTRAKDTLVYLSSGDLLKSKKEDNR